jgi:succinate dehydrogenase/fumarate reductase cytochrome b subunit
VFKFQRFSRAVNTMLLKTIIVVLFIAVVISLFSGLRFLVKDLGNSKRRLLFALGLRITLAGLLIGTVIFGAYTGQLSSKAPWDRQLHPEATTPYPIQAPPKQ